MTNAAQYAAACAPDRWRVCGVRLRPLCIGHALLLQRCGSPFLGDGNDGKNGTYGPGLADLLLVLFVCSRGPGEAREALGRGLGVRWWWRAWRIKVGLWLRPEILLHRMTMLVNYLREGMRGPQYFAAPNQGRPAGTPSLLMLKLALMSELGYSEGEALGMPISQAKWEIFALREMEGSIEITNEIEQAVMSGGRDA